MKQIPNGDAKVVIILCHMNLYPRLKVLICIVVVSFFIPKAPAYGQPDLKVNVSEWKLINALDKSASVYSPQQMEIRIDSIATDIGKVLTVHHVLRQSTEYSPNFLFQLSYTMYPEGLIPEDSIAMVQDLLKTTVDNAVLMQNAELLYSANKKYKDHQGVIWKTRYANGAYVMKSEIYFAQDHLYMLQVGSVADTPTGNAVEHFFGSFKIEDFAFRKE